MKLVMFDMDGTLTDSFAFDHNCYVLAIERALNLTGVVAEWESYPHTSSSCCLEEIVRRHRGHAPTEAESRAVQACLIEHMTDLHRQHGRCTAEIPGAAACLQALQDAGHAIAIASGDWESTARHKLTTARIPHAAIPAAFCDVSHVRIEIMRTALARAAARHGGAKFDRIVYVGDAAWDVRACRELGWPLVGVGHGTHASKLRALGTSHVIPDYAQLGPFLAALDDAAVPGSPA